jgi:tRNA(fMet)-specific endonuclease VapC
MKFMPDTNALSRHMRGSDPALSARMREAIADDEFIFAFVVYAELAFGAEKALLAGERRPLERLHRLCETLPVAPLSGEVAETYGKLRARLEKRGERIGNMDIMLAAHALALDAVIVTHNVREFSRIPGLKVEDWQED